MNIGRVLRIQLNILDAVVLSKSGRFLVGNSSGESFSKIIQWVVTAPDIAHENKSLPKSWVVLEIDSVPLNQGLRNRKTFVIWRIVYNDSANWMELGYTLIKMILTFLENKCVLLVADLSHLAVYTMQD